MSIQQRKSDHIDLCATDEVEFRARTTLLECVELIHQSLPDLAWGETDTSVHLLGKRLRLPLVIAAMTGGTERAAEINQNLAKLAEERGLGFGLGSQRAMARVPESAWTYEVRAIAPRTLIMGNIGVVQAREWSTEKIRSLMSQIGADALCVHMNPAMELVQREGDRDFRAGRETIARLIQEMGMPVVPKETGCGISFNLAQDLRALGAKVVDVSGSGGTSWVAVEALRSKDDPMQQALGQLLWDWGIPTAVTTSWCAKAGLSPIATGGIQTGLDVARAIALGATAAGIARPLLQAFMQGGLEGARARIDRIELELKAAMLLCGARTLSDLRTTPKVVKGELCQWLLK